MKKKIRIILVLLVVIAIILGIVVFHHFSTAVSYNTGYVNGNTAGNLYNGGSFCESNGTVFFSNPDDGNKLYSMDSDGSNLKKISSDYATFINADDNYIYYVRNNVEGDAQNSVFRWNTNSLCRMSRKGGDATILDPDPCYYACLVGNYIYYLHYDDTDGMTLYKVKIDATDRGQLLNAPYIMCDGVDKYIYYHGVESDHNLYRFDTSNDNSSNLYDGSIYSPTVLGSTAYYMNCDDNYSLASLDMNTKTATTIITDRVDCYNIYENTIFYQRNSPGEPALCKASLNGSTNEEIQGGNFTEINVTSKYIYFKRFEDDSIVYRLPTSGVGTMEEFHPGVIEK